MGSPEVAAHAAWRWPCRAYTRGRSPLLATLGLFAANVQPFGFISIIFIVMGDRGAASAAAEILPLSFRERLPPGARRRLKCGAVWTVTSSARSGGRHPAKILREVSGPLSIRSPCGSRCVRRAAGVESVPGWVEHDFRAYLRCGILAHGFARARCPDCGHERLVAFSCKGRGACPCCNAFTTTQHH